MNELYKLEQFSRDSFRVKRTYIDVAGDLISGMLLGQIVYWNLPNENGNSKLRVRKENALWLAKGRNDWWDEIRITPKQFDRAIKILKDKNLVEVKNFKFNGSPTVHIKLNIKEVTEKVNSILSIEENGNSPKVKKEINETVNSLTEITTETTTEIKNNKYTRYAEFVKMKESEFNKLVTEHGEELTKRMITVLDNYKGANGKTYKSDYRAILNWVADKVVKENGGKSNGSVRPSYEGYNFDKQREPNF